MQFSLTGDFENAENIYEPGTIFEDEGKRYFQIDTYGRATRDMPEKISQTIQIDRQSAMKLISLLAETFKDSE